MIVFTILCIIALIIIIAIGRALYIEGMLNDIFEWVLYILIGIVVVFVALLVAVFALSIPVSDVTTSEELIDTKELRALNDRTQIEGRFSSGIFVHSGSINEKPVYAFYYEDKESGGIKYGSIPAETTTIYLIGENEKPKVEEYTLYETYISVLTAPMECTVPSKSIYKLYVPDGSITTDITLDLKK